MKKKFEAIIWDLMEQYSNEKQVPNMWAVISSGYISAKRLQQERFLISILTEHQR